MGFACKRDPRRPEGKNGQNDVLKRTAIRKLYLKKSLYNSYYGFLVLIINLYVLMMIIWGMFSLTHLQKSKHTSEVFLEGLFGQTELFRTACIVSSNRLYKCISIYDGLKPERKWGSKFVLWRGLPWESFIILAFYLG